ncbi:hypothetical protein [Algoriphagus formosus]|uniref:hypothetical protein n=1 Tax=Algoriphagus formosus TaxID=2007308 RepID=UPI003F6ECC38
MAWGTREQKGELMLMGLSAGLSFLDTLAKESDKLNKEGRENPKSIDEDELLRILEINEEYSTRIHNLLNDTELGCKFKKTEEIFLLIIEIIMLDLESDYQEVISNFTKSFDTEEFIKSHEDAIEKRKMRLKIEYEEAMKNYEIKYKEYLEKKKNTGFFKTLIGNSPIEPLKPILRT